jgi:5-methylcytosine-specific restriction endonuclease McrA
VTKRNTARRDHHRRTLARDRPACYLCGHPIDYSLPHTDPMAYQVDHVVPLVRGGADTLANKRAAHRSCNSTKRARDIAPIVRRSGALA